MKIIAVFFLMTCSLLSGADLRERILQTYSFSPRELNREQFKAKGKELDDFWDEVRSAPAVYLPQLRTALRSSEYRSYFYFDGASLLFLLSKQPDDLQLIVSSVGKVPLEDLDWRGYFDFVRAFGKAGGHTAPLALKILENKKFIIAVPAHALVLGPDFCLIYMTKDEDPGVVAAEFTRAYQENSDDEIKAQILKALWYTLDPLALRFIDDQVADEKKSPELRALLVDLQSRNKLRKGSGLFSGSLAGLRTRRKAVLDRLSDEALEEYEDLTRKILAKIPGK